MRDMGLGLVDIAATIDATVSRRVHDMLVDPENHPWKKLYRHQLWKHYRHKRPLTRLCRHGDRNLQASIPSV
eukprot:1343535-Prymnesium_polylepis.1